MKNLISTLLIFVCASLISCEVDGQTEGTSKGIELISVDEAAAKLTSEDIVLLDVRTPEEVAEGYISGALHWDYYEWDTFKEKVASLEKSKPVMVYCKAGGRSNKAAQFLKKQGCATIYDLKGGMNAWKASNNPIVKK